MFLVYNIIVQNGTLSADFAAFWDALFDIARGIWYLGTRDPGDYGCFFFVFFSVRCILKAHETKRKWTNSVRMTLHGLREYHQAPNTHRVLVRYPPLTCNTTL